LKKIFSGASKFDAIEVLDNSGFHNGYDPPLKKGGCIRILPEVYYTIYKNSYNSRGAMLAPK